jgi:squalene-hopene/tetraprenyl-beta-curcumene cyclase
VLHLSKTEFAHIKKKGGELKEKFHAYLDDHVELPGGLSMHFFPASFFEADYYLVFPSLFKKVFRHKENRFTDDLCIAGYFYFKYLLCIDALVDNDSDEDKGVILLKSHVYHEEGMKILGRHFGKNELFWQLWQKRSGDFLSSILLDKVYNPEMSFDVYRALAANKCSFSKVAIDAYYSKSNNEEGLFNALNESFDHFSVARCLQDDLEDFRKDLKHKKNNWGHVLLHRWLKSKGKSMKDYEPEILEKYLFTSEKAEELLTLSRTYYQKAIDAVKPYENELSDYLAIIEKLKNVINFYKVNVQAYRVNKLMDTVCSTTPARKSTIANAVSSAKAFLRGIQNRDGSWFEVSNMQGLSNVWATGFISMYLDSHDEGKQNASNFLLANKQGSLWGYNNDWTFDYDSTTCVLTSLRRSDVDVNTYLSDWFRGQLADGSFRTYDVNHELLRNLGLKREQLKGWTQGHLCVSALAYHFLSDVPMNDELQGRYDLLRNFILRSRNRDGVWRPYWWTSYLYPTCLILQTLANDDAGDDTIIKKAVSKIIAGRNTDGSYSCELTGEKSAFYTAMVLDTFSSSEKLMRYATPHMSKTSEWLLDNQREDGHFAGTNFLVIPNPTVKKWNPSNHGFKVNKAGAGNSITGEIAGLFSTAVASRALERYAVIK